MLVSICALLAAQSIQLLFLLSYFADLQVWKNGENGKYLVGPRGEGYCVVGC